MKKFSVVAACMLTLMQSCNVPKNELIKIEGEAQGTTWHISYISNEKMSLKNGVDSILRKLDSSLSTYLPVSIISRVNQNDSTARLDSHFIEVFNRAMEVSDKTGGLFDVSIAPLVNAWGFGFSKKEKISDAVIDSLLPLVNYRSITIKNNRVVKARPGMQLDFNAIGQGYSVDVLAGYLQSKGIRNYLVELGGELIASGSKFDEDWKVGIDLPTEQEPMQRTLSAVIPLHNRAMATSGNYRKFYVEDGKKYAHIINPNTGYPAKSDIISATVLANNATTADAYATVFMVMGLNQSKTFLTQNAAMRLDVYFIYEEAGKWKTYISDSSLHIKEVLP